MKNKTKKFKLNRLNLWFLFGMAWFIPQIIIIYLPESYQIIKIILLCLFGLLIGYSSCLDKLLIEEENEK